MVKIATHHDADGIYSCAMWLFANGYAQADLSDPKKTDIIVPKFFGEVPDDVDVVLDMLPKNPDTIAETAQVFDHHPNHPEERKYQLCWESNPTGLIMYHQFAKQLIEKGKDWLVAGSLVGDGQPELIPSEIFQRHIGLLDDIMFVRESYGKMTYSRFPAYFMLSSAINNLAKVGHPEEALWLIMGAKNALDIIHNDKARDARDILSKDETRSIKTMKSVEFRYVQYASFNSEYQIQAGLARKLNENSHKTCLVYNLTTNTFSIRGSISQMVVDALKPLCTEVGGHLGYAGGSLKPTVTETDLQNALRNLLRS